MWKSEDLNLYILYRKGGKSPIVLQWGRDHRFPPQSSALPPLSSSLFLCSTSTTNDMRPKWVTSFFFFFFCCSDFISFMRKNCVLWFDCILCFVLIVFLNFVIVEIKAKFFNLIYSSVWSILRKNGLENEHCS